MNPCWDKMERRGSMHISAYPAPICRSLERLLAPLIRLMPAAITMCIMQSDERPRLRPLSSTRRRFTLGLTAGGRPIASYQVPGTKDYGPEAKKHQRRPVTLPDQSIVWAGPRGTTSLPGRLNDSPGTSSVGACLYNLQTSAARGTKGARWRRAHSPRQHTCQWLVAHGK
jgi:hypothetical protein